MKKIYLSALVTFISLTGFAQSTFNRVYTILQTNCAATCHSNATKAGNLNLSGNEQAVYNALVGKNPSNPTALLAGNKLIDPGDTRNSFLFKKVHRGLDVNLSLLPTENPSTHDTLTALTQVEREMIRQWILFGAKDTGTWVNEQVIHDFYVTQGGQPRIEPLAPPAANEGVQIYWGPLFMPVGHEFEYDNKFKVRNSGEIDVTRMNVRENTESHHFAVYKYHPGADTAFPAGMQLVSGIGDAAALFYAADVIAQWPNDIDLRYPQGTAYIWQNDAVINISFHLINYNDSIIAAEAYMNIYYGPHQANTIPIKTDQIRYGGNNVSDLVIFPGTGDSTFTIDQYHPDSTFLWNIISMQAHTHKQGKNYNVMLRGANGEPGDTIYKGTYNANYTFDQFVYLWDNPPYRQFDPPLPVDMTRGLIHEAIFRRHPTDTVGFGLRTIDEMFVTFIVYYKGPYTDIRDDIYRDSNLKIYPNPVVNTAFIELTDGTPVNNAELKIYDLLGKEVAGTRGITDSRFMVDMGHLPNGYYMYRLTNNGVLTGAGKVVVRR